MGNPTDQTIEQLAAEWVAFEFWTVDRLCGGPVYCARRRDDHSRVFNADSPQHLAEYLEDSVSEPVGHGWLSGTSGTERSYPHPDDPPPDMPVTAAVLRAMYRDWEIIRDERLGAWTAERRDGNGLHFIAAVQAWELGLKIKAAESDDGRRIDGSAR